MGKTSPAQDVTTADHVPSADGEEFDATQPIRVSLALPIIVFAIFSVAVGMLGYVDYLWQHRAFAEEKQNELAAIADLKARQIDSWLRERRGDAKVMMHAPFFGLEVERWLLRGAPADKTGKRLLQRLQTLKTAYDYHALVLLDRRAAVRLATDGGKAVAADELELARRAMRDKQVVISDLHREQGGSGMIELGLFAPLLVEENGVARTVGVLYFSIDASRYLYPLIQTWPTPSKSAETLLVRRDGDDVLFLNELRHRKGVALKLRLPVSTPDLPSARFLRGESGIVEGRDYRGVPVLAVARSVAEHSWLLVAKVDSAEVFSPLIARMAFDAILALLLIAAAALGLGFWWRQQQMRALWRHYREMAQLNAGLEQRVAERTAQLEAGNKDLEAFSYSVSHDLRAPLRAVQGFAGILARGHYTSLNDEGRHYLDNIIVASAHMERMIEDLLRYARLGSKSSRGGGKPLREVLTEVAENFREWARESGTALIFPAEAPDVAVNETLLAQVLNNLIANALIYRRAGVAHRVEVACTREGDRLLVSVADNGVGIAPEHHEKIFNVFQRLHGEEDYPGTGIGLALVKKAAELLGGKVWLQSAPGEGSVFFVAMPLISTAQ